MKKRKVSFTAVLAATTILLLACSAPESKDESAEGHSTQATTVERDFEALSDQVLDFAGHFASGDGAAVEAMLSEWQEEGIRILQGSSDASRPEQAENWDGIELPNLQFADSFGAEDPQELNPYVLGDTTIFEVGASIYIALSPSRFDIVLYGNPPLEVFPFGGSTDGRELHPGWVYFLSGELKPIKVSLDSNGLFEGRHYSSVIPGFYEDGDTDIGNEIWLDQTRFIKFSWALTEKGESEIQDFAQREVCGWAEQLLIRKLIEDYNGQDARVRLACEQVPDARLFSPYNPVPLAQYEYGRLVPDEFKSRGGPISMWPSQYIEDAALHGSHGWSVPFLTRISRLYSPSLDRDQEIIVEMAEIQDSSGDWKSIPVDSLWWEGDPGDLVNVGVTRDGYKSGLLDPFLWQNPIAY
jgi:hypothetical protein